MIQPPELKAGDRLRVGFQQSTVIPDMDFETYSEAGYWFDDQAQKWRLIDGVPKGTTNGLAAVGAAAYSEHPSTELLSLAYDLKDGAGKRLWVPGMEPPADLFRHIQSGGLIEAHNSLFEYFIWLNVCHPRMGWPALPLEQVRDSMAKARAFGVPGALARAGEALNIPVQKDADGTRLLNKFSKPHTPTKKDPRTRIRPEEEPADAARLYSYNLDDIKAESGVSQACPDLQPGELEVWQIDQRINARGVAIDTEALKACRTIVEQATERYTRELVNITDGEVRGASEVQKMTAWLARQGVHTSSLAEDHVEPLLARDDLPANARRVLEIRRGLAGSSVKKVYSIERRLSSDGRLRDLFNYCGAERTGRFCIAEGEPVLVKDSRGRVAEVAIEDVADHWKLWDGMEWVRHQGVVSAGVKHVIEYDGVCATPDHRVYTSGTHYTTLAELRDAGERIFRGEKRIRGRFAEFPPPGPDRVVPTYDIVDAGPRNRFCVNGRIVHNSGSGPQPQNLPSGGPAIKRCDPISGCGKRFGAHHTGCPWCGAPDWAASGDEWGPEAVDEALEIIRTGSLDLVEYYYGDAVTAVSGCLRGLFVAGEGRELICSDYSAIEAVVLAALAGEQWRLEVFRTHGRIYEMSAAKITGTSFADIMAHAGFDVSQESWWGHQNATGPHHPLRKKIGKVAELASGFGGGLGAWKNFGADKFLSEDDIRESIKLWREASPQIVNLWHGLERAAKHAIRNPGQCFSYRVLTYAVHNDVLYCRLPSGRFLCYHQPRLQESWTPWGSKTDKITFMERHSQSGKWVRNDTYGGKLTENCIARGTEVLTDRGWVEIQEVRRSDLVHDGVEFVGHGGKVFKGVQTCGTVDGVKMTDDHEVLTDDGWKAASQKPRPYRPDLRGAHCSTPGSHEREEKKVGVPLRMRKRVREDSHRRKERCEQGPNAELRVHDKGATGRRQTDPRNDRTPSVCDVALYARQVHESEPPRMEELRRTWGDGLRPVDPLVREFLGGHGADLRPRVGAGQAGQQRRILPGKLPLGEPSGQHQQPADLCFRGHTLGASERGRGRPALGGRGHDDTLPAGPRVAGGRTVPQARSKEPVYDILNAGPRQRFVVRGAQGPFIVHNCVQAVSRDIMASRFAAVERAGYEIVLHVHDELCAEAPTGTKSVEELEAIMADMPAWCRDWPISAAGGWKDKRFRKD